MKNKTNKKKSRMAVNNAASKKEYKQPKHNIPKQELESEASEKSNGIAGKLLILIIVIIVAMIFIFMSGAFNISEIIVEENNIISKEQIISFSGIEIGSNLFSISKKDVENRLKENSYIESVEINRVFPDKIKLIINERKVEYVLQLANSYVYINSQGYVLEISNNKPEVPIILGFTTDLSNIKPGNRLEENDLNKMNIVIRIMETAKKNEMQNLITKIDISNEENYTIYLDTENKIAYLGNGTELNTRFLYIKAILKEQQGKSGEIFVDMDLNSEYAYFREKV